MGNLWITQDDAGTCRGNRIPVEVLISECRRHRQWASKGSELADQLSVPSCCSAATARTRDALTPTIQHCCRPWPNVASADGNVFDRRSPGFSMRLQLGLVWFAGLLHDCQ